MTATIPSSSAVPSVPAPTLEAVGEDVYAYVQHPGGWCLNNAGVLVGRNGVTLVDTAATEARGTMLKTAVEALGAGPVRTVINTHHHSDHVFGNYLFGPATTILAHALARVEMAKAGLGITQLWPNVNWGGVQVALPSVTIRNRVTIHVDDRPVELIPVGPAHTTNDVLVWLPDQRVLFTGDVVLSGCTPFVQMGSITGTLHALDLMRDLGARTVVCGHGPICGPEVFDRTESYLRWLQKVAAAGFGRDVTPLSLARGLDLGEFAHMLDSERIVANLHRAFAEERGGPLGEPLDVVAIFGEMVAYNGGKLPTCLA